MTNQPMKRAVAIIGAGFSGITTALRLRACARGPLTVYLLDNAGEYGGLAYSNTDSFLTMNGMAQRLSAFDESPDHFVNWLQSRGGELAEKSFQELKCHYALRRLYGDYLRDLISESTGPSPAGVVIERIQADVVSIERLSGKYRLRLGETLELVTDSVVLASGYLRPRRLCHEPWQECLEDPWSVNAIMEISTDATVLIVGTGQSMMDVVFLLLRLGHKGQIYAISRRGLLSHCHADRETEYPLDPDRLPQDINGLVRYVRKSAREWTDLGGDWRAVMNSLRPHTQRLWMALSHREKRRFLEHVAPYWRIHRTRVPPYMWNAIQELLSSGQLKCLRGRLHSMERTSGRVRIEVYPRAEDNSASFEVDKVINCSGPECDYGRATSQLFKHLLESGLITCHPIGLGINVKPNGAIIDRLGNVSTTMFAVGPPCMGTLWEINVIREIRKQASHVAAELANHYTTG